MADTIFIDFGTLIPGSALNANFTGKVALNSFSFGGNKEMTDEVSSTKRTTGKTVLGDVTCTKQMDVATAIMFEYMLFAKELPTVTLTYGDNTGDKGAWKNTVVYKMEKVYIKAMATSGSGSLPTDTFTLNYVKMTCTYVQQKSDGTVGGQSAFDWDKSTNT